MPIYEYACRACGHEFETLDKKLSVLAAPGSEAEAVAPCGSCGHPRGPAPAP